MFKCCVVSVLFSLCFSFCHAQPLAKIYAALNAGDYETVNEKLQRSASKSDPALDFARARYYFQQDNPSHQLDSAKVYTMRTARGIDGVEKKSTIKRYSKLGVRRYNVDDLNQRINEQAYTRAVVANTVESWNHFLTTYSDSKSFDDARQRRNRLAFEQARDSSDPVALKSFLDTYPDASEATEARSLYEQVLYMQQTGDSTWRAYKRFMDEQPNSPFIAKAKANYERLLYADLTKSRTAESYASFITQYPESPYRSKAEDSLYAHFSKPIAIVTKLQQFVRRYPQNRNAHNAWEKLFWLSTNGSDSSVQRFVKQFPEYPRRHELEQNSISKKQLVKFSDEELIGFKDSLTNDVVIPAIYWDLGEFSEGLVAATKENCDTINCRYGYIDAKNRQIIEPKFSEANPFFKGYAVAGIGYCSNDSCLYGMINKAGDFVVRPMYHDLSPFANNRALVRRDTLYGFIDSVGNEIIPPRYNDANEFGEGLAAVFDTTWKFIDAQGNVAFAGTFSGAGVFSEGLCAAANHQGVWGYIGRDGNWVIKPQFTDAGGFKNGKAKVNVPGAKNSATAKPDKERWIDKAGKFIKAEPGS